MAQILINDLIRVRMGNPFLDWDDAKGFYERLYLSRWDDPIQDIDLWHQARILFDAVMPDLRPANIQEVVRFIREDKAVESMRNELWECLKSGESISTEFFLRYANKAIQRELTLKEKMKKFRLVGSVITSLIPGSGIVQEVVTSGAEEFIENKLAGRAERSMEWFYALQREAIRRKNDSRPSHSIS